jgi:ATP dependent DNA ligase domain
LLPKPPAKGGPENEPFERTGVCNLATRGANFVALLYAFDLIEHDGEDLRDRPFLDRKAALVRLLRDTNAGILLNEQLPKMARLVFALACRLGAEGIVSKQVDGTYRPAPCPVRIKVRNPASIAVQREHSEKWNRLILSGTRRSGRYRIVSVGLSQTVAHCGVRLGGVAGIGEREPHHGGRSDRYECQAYAAFFRLPQSPCGQTAGRFRS